MINGLSQRHEFAIYIDKATIFATTYAIDDHITLENAQLYHRIVHVLRLNIGNSFILFDQNYNITCELNSISKKSIGITIIAIQSNKISPTHITFLLPLLKRESFQEAIYSLCELGAGSIQPIITQKIHRSWQGEREKERLQRIIHAAAEQSKNFAFPTIHSPLTLEQGVRSISPEAMRIFFDPHGTSLFPLIKNIKNEKPKQLALIIGPEADLSQSEKDFLHENQFIFCKLTHTILRAQQAAAISLGIFQSML